MKTRTLLLNNILQSLCQSKKHNQPTFHDADNFKLAILLIDLIDDDFMIQNSSMKLTPLVEEWNQYVKHCETLVTNENQLGLKFNTMKISSLVIGNPSIDFD